MSRQYCTINASNLIAMGIYDDVYILYADIYSVYKAMLDSLPSSHTSAHNEEKACKKYARLAIEAFLKTHTIYFTDKHKRLHVNSHDMVLFRFLQYPTSRQKKMPSLCTFTTFLKLLFDVINFSFTRYETKRCDYKLTEDSTEILSHYIERLANQYRKMGAETCSYQDTVNTEDVYVVSALSRITCNSPEHTVRPRRYIAHKIDGTGCILLPIHQCTTCGKRFIGKQTLRAYQQEFGRVFICAKTNEKTKSKKHTSFDDWRSESRLYSFGYNVAKEGLTEKERQDLLVFLMKHNIMSYFEICKDIETAIETHSFSDRNHRAIEKWSRDLLFLGKYVSNHSSHLDAH